MSLKQRKCVATVQPFKLPIVLFLLFFLSCLSTYSPCPLSHYLPITSSSCGLLVTMETIWFALLLSTLVHFSLFSSQLLGTVHIENRMLMSVLFGWHMQDEVGVEEEWWLLCFQHCGPLLSSTSVWLCINISPVFTCFAVWLCLYTHIIVCAPLFLNNV